MKSKAGLFWFVVSLVLGGLLIVQWKGREKQQLMMEKLQLQVEKSAGKPDLEARVKELEKERLKLNGELRAAEYALMSS